MPPPSRCSQLPEEDQHPGVSRTPQSTAVNDIRVPRPTLFSRAPEPRGTHKRTTTPSTKTTTCTQQLQISSTPSVATFSHPQRPSFKSEMPLAEDTELHFQDTDNVPASRQRRPSPCRRLRPAYHRPTSQPYYPTPPHNISFPTMTYTSSLCCTSFTTPALSCSHAQPTLYHN